MHALDISFCKLLIEQGLSISNRFFSPTIYIQLWTHWCLSGASDEFQQVKYCRNSVAVVICNNVYILCAAGMGKCRETHGGG